MWLEDSVQLSTKADLYEYLIKIAKTPRKMVLTDTVIETLSIIAYKQPVTRLEIEKIRGVSCDHAINKLLEYELITELGRKDAPGRPLLFGTTEQFLRCFGVKSIEELPELSLVQVEEFKQQAEAEAGILAADTIAENALEERKALACKLGEEAGTKMLLPLMMMLGIVIAIIMIPAMLSFQV